MNQSGEAAESIIRMSLDGMKFAVSVGGAGAKNIIALLYTILKDNKKIKGKTSLKKMIKSERSLKVFTLKKGDLKAFKELSKQYGVLFCALSDRKNKALDGMVDIIVRSEDAPKINRIVERFKLSTVEEKATIKSKPEKEKQKKRNSKEEQLVDEVILSSTEKDMVNPNPNVMTTESPQSDRSSKSKDFSEGSSKPSVRKRLRDIKMELSRKIEMDRSKEKTHIKSKISRGGR